MTEKNNDCDRLVSFSDAIFSIAITLCVLDIAPADLSHRVWVDGAKSVLLDLQPKFMWIGITFFIVSLYWLAHHRLFGAIRKTSPLLIRLNLLFLLDISLMPFAVKISGARPEDAAAAMIYAGYMATTGFIIHLMWRHAIRNHLLSEEASTPVVVRYNLARTLVSPGVFLLSMVAAYWSPGTSKLFWVGALFSGKIAQYYSEKTK